MRSIRSRYNGYLSQGNYFREPIDDCRELTNYYTRLPRFQHQRSQLSGFPTFTTQEQSSKTPNIPKTQSATCRSMQSIGRTTPKSPFLLPISSSSRDPCLGSQPTLLPSPNPDRTDLLTVPTSNPRESHALNSQIVGPQIKRNERGRLGGVPNGPIVSRLAYVKPAVYVTRSGPSV